MHVCVAEPDALHTPALAHRLRAWQVAEVRGVLAGLAAEYATRLRTFVALLPTQTPVDLNFLLFRLEAGKGDAAAV